MIEEKIEQFQSLAGRILPMILRHAKEEDIEVYEEYALITYNLSHSFEISDLMTILENHPEMQLCYVTKPCEATYYGTTCCGFSMPRRRCKFKVNGMTNSYGKVDKLTVTVYISLEYMLNDIRYDLESHMERCSLSYNMGITNLLRIFSV